MVKFNKVCVVGLGYIGLPTAAVIASRRVHVVGVDIRPNVVDTINEGNVHIVEPRLDMLVHATITEGYLRASTIPEESDAYIIAVPTPFKVGHGNSHLPDLDHIENATHAIATFLKKGDLIVLESTSPVGTTEKVADWLRDDRPDLTFPQTHGEDSDVRVAHCPERVLPGHVVRELVENDRVIGGMTSVCSERAVELYKLFVEGECITTSSRTAEMAKLTENSFRDVNIAFANELSIICDKQGIDVWELIDLANRHPRVDILQPGPGVGGHCIAVDPWFIVSESPDEARLIRMAREVNDSKPEWVVGEVMGKLADFLHNNPDKDPLEITIACLGLAFKANIDDLRESPALGIVNRIRQVFSGKLLVVEPNIDELPESLAGKAVLTDLATALKSEICLLLVDHNEFKENLPPAPGESIIVDTRGIWS